MSGFFEGMSAEAVQERLAEQVAQAQQRAAAATAVRVDIQALQERVSSPRNELTVVVDATGRLLDLALTDAAVHLGPRALGRLIVATAMKAQQAAGERAARIAADAFGDDDPAVAHLRAELAERAPKTDGIEYR